MDGKDHCCVTTGQIKARNFAECPLVLVTRQNITIGADSRMISSLLRMKFLFYFSICFSLSSLSYSSVMAVHLIFTVYITVVKTRECVCIIMIHAVLSL